MKKLMVNKTVRKMAACMITFILVVCLLIPEYASTIAGSTSVEITKSTGGLESAFVKWQPVSGATGYNVYYKVAGDKDLSYVKLDDMLVRQYPSYIRADAVGLAAGSYVMKVVPVMGSGENSAKASVTGELVVSAYDRTGFAWVGGTSSGAYNEDGTLKSNADVIYVTEETKDTVQLDVIKDAKGTTQSATGLQNILTLVKKGYAKPLDIRVIGNITKFATSEQGDIAIDGGSKGNGNGITMEGIGEDATANGWGVRMKNATNVELRNIGFMNCSSSEGDDVGLQQGNNHIWVHNCDMFYGDAGSDADQVKGDGSLDCKKSTYITFSYNHFWDCGKCNLLGLKGEDDKMYITYHHNWYDHSDSRHPRVRSYSAHVYNNYYDGNAKYGIGACMGSSVFAENNYFRNCKYPMMISEQGSDVYNGNEGTFSSENGGMIKASGNVMSGEARFVDQTYSATDFDAIMVSNASEKVDSSYVTRKGGTSYNNFDTNTSIMYAYTPDTAEIAMQNVQKYAGRVDGGDFKWTFDNAVDDEAYAVNQPLKTALVNYKSSLVKAGGIIPVTQDETTAEMTTAAQTTTATQLTTGVQTTTAAQTTTPAQTTTAAQTTSAAKVYVHNFTTSGKASDFYNITGNLSTSKGTVNYKGLTLTQCIKLESSTNITFTATGDGLLTLVFNKSTANVKMDSKKYVATDGVLIIPIVAGNHTITKADSNNIYYIEFAVAGSEETVAPTIAPTTASTSAASTAATQPTTSTEASTEQTTSSGNQPQPGDYDENDTGVITNLSQVTDNQYQTVVYCEPNALDTGVGTSDSPMSLSGAITFAATNSGTAIILNEGTYKFDKQMTIPFGNNGTQNAYKVLKAADGANVTLDFSAEVYGDTATNGRGLQIEGDYWYVYGIKVTGSADNGIFVAGKHNVVERCVLYANRDSGLQISRRLSTLSNKADWPSDNYIINCTSYDNRDTKTGENADGFAVKLTCGDGNVLDGCIAYCNCDDGYDLYAKEATGSIGVVTIRNCIAFNNGTLTNGNSEANGDMNGFKLGGSNGKVPTAHKVFNCLAMNNGKDGFTDNGNGGALSITSCTSYNNTKSNLNFYRTTAGGTFTNLLSAKTTGSDKFIGILLNCAYSNSKKFYKTDAILPIAVKNGERVGTIISDPAATAFISTTLPDVKDNIDSIFRSANGTVTTNGCLMVKADSGFATMGAKFGVSTGMLKMNASVKNSSQPTEPTTEEIKTDPVEEPITKQIKTNAVEQSTAVQPTQVEPTQVEPTQVEPTQVEPTQAEPTQAEPTQAEPTQVEPTQVQPTAAQTIAAQSTVPTTTTEQSTIAVDNADGNVKTGDTSRNIGIYAIILCVSCGTVLLTMTNRNKENHKDN